MAREPWRLRWWFYAAAVYNAVWGATHVAAPTLVPNALGVRELDPMFWQALGFFVGVYAPAYVWVARAPERHAQLVVVAVLGKVLGPIGFACGAADGRLPVSFVFVVVLNDLVWLPAFGRYLRTAARSAGGWRALLAGG